MQIFKKLPYPIVGLALGSAVLGNLVKQDFPMLRTILGVISLVIIAMIIIKLALFSSKLNEQMDNPVVFGSFAAFPMAITVLSTYTSGTLARIVFFLGIILHVLLIIKFTLKYVVNFDIKKVFPAWFVMYVGIVAGSVAAPSIAANSLGRIFFWFGLISYVVLLIPAIYRVFVIKNVPDMAKPALAIFAAPASLLLAGYLAVFEKKSPTFVLVLLIFSIVFYIVGLYFFAVQVSLPFYPSYAAYTFPYVISAVATKGANAFLTKIGQSIAYLSILASIQLYVALFMVTYVLIRYIIFMTQKSK